MAALTALYPTIVDLQKATDPDGRIAKVIEALNLSNEILDYMVWQEGNLVTGHRSTIRTGIPLPTWRKMYGGVAPTKSTTATITDNTGMLENYLEVDVALANLNGNSAAFMAQQQRAIIEGFNQTVATTLFYGNEGTNPDSFTGLTPRFNSLSATNADHIIVGGGSGTDNASIWLQYFSPDTCFGIVPKGSVAGMQVTDKGQVTKQNVDGAGAMYEAYITHYRWDLGLCMPDWRGTVRIPNIDKSDLTKTGTTGADLPDLMFQAMETIPVACRVGRPVFFMSRLLLSTLRRQLANKTSGSTLEIMDVGGKRVTAFQGIPLCRCDALAADEALVT